MRCLLITIVKSFKEQQTGLTLLEVLIAMFILGTVGVGLLSALDTSFRSTRTIDEHVVADNLAASYLEEIKDHTYAVTYPNLGENITIPFQYSVTLEIECSDDGVNFGACTGSDNETLQRIRVAISREGRPVSSMCTYKSKR